MNENLRDKFLTSLAGAGAGIVTSIVTCPLDVLKTRLQNERKMNGVKNNLGMSLTNIFQKEGVKGLFSGLTPNMLGYIPNWAIYFTVYETSKHNLSTTFKSKFMIEISSAAMAGACSTICTSPLWLIKTRFMIQKVKNGKYRSIRHAIKEIYQHEGIRGFYKGLTPSLFGISHVAIQFPLYEKLKRDLKNEKMFPLAMMTSKIVASSTTYPHEVIRTRLQSQSIMPYKYENAIHAIKLIYSEEGKMAFYKGFGTNLLRTVPANVVTLMTFEWLERKLK